jgi:DNA polymerase-4
MRLRRIHYFTNSMTLSIKYQKGERWDESTRFQETQDTLELIHVLNQLWERRPRHGGPLLRVGVTLLGLQPAHSVTPSLFADPKRQKLNELVDTLNAGLGKNTVYFGGAHTAVDAAPMRIAFNNIPNLETEDEKPREKKRPKALDAEIVLDEEQAADSQE